jgi:signal transduction histidine kinase
MRPGVRALILVLILAPAVALCLLGHRALRAEEADARREAAASARRIREDLEAYMANHLAARRLAVTTGAPPPLSFLVQSSGTIERPATRSYPAGARTFASGDLVALRGLLERTDRLIFGEGAPREALNLLDPAIEVFEDEDLAAIVRDRAALACKRMGSIGRAIVLSWENLDEHPGARDLEGFPLAIPAALRCAAVYRESGREKMALGIERRLAALLAENPWNLRAEQRTLLLRGLPRVPEETTFGAVRAIVLPEISVAEAGHEWTTLRGRAAGRTVLVTYHAVSDGRVEGIVIPEDALREQMSRRSSEIARVTGATISTESAAAPEDAETVAGSLGPPFEGLTLLVAVTPSTAGHTLTLLWAGLSILLIGSLTTGVALGLRAVSREVRLARLRQEFLDNVSHELRTPLASIRTLAENLEDGTVPDERRTEYFAALNRESRRVARLVQDVLDLSRLDRGATGLRRETFDPEDLAHTAVEELAAEPTAADFVVGVDCGEDLPALTGDPDSLRRALLNLLVNAARYSREDRTAELVVGNGEGVVRFAVRDRGPGIPAADRRAVFDRFHRIPSDTHEVKGAGLGLPLALAIARAHGGTIRLESEVGRGSTFTLEIPHEPSASHRG